MQVIFFFTWIWVVIMYSKFSGVFGLPYRLASLLIYGGMGSHSEGLTTSFQTSSNDIMP